jgi:hypothetical protein
LRFLALFLAAAVALAAGYAGLARTVDPRGEFGSRIFPVVSSEARAEKMRLFQAYAAEAAPEGLVLGSSRAMKVRPETLAQSTGHRFFNFAVDNARAEDYLAIYRWVRQQGVRPKLLIVGLDVEALHDDDRAEASLLQDGALMATLGSERPAERGLLAPFRGSAAVRLAKQYKATFTVEYLADILSALRLSLFPRLRPLPLMEFEPDGYLRYRRWERERAAGSFRFGRDLERCLTRSAGRFEAMRQLSGRRRAYVQELADEARAQGAHVVLWITTLHPATTRFLEARTGYAALLDATRSYLRSLARAGVAGFDFSRPESYQGTESGFYDCLHIDETNADRLMAALGPELR